MSARSGEIVPPTDRQVLVAQANALWHTDSSFKKTPALASVLSARVLPGADGDTEFTSTRLAWERLPARPAGQAEERGGDALLRQQPRPDPSRPRQRRGAQGAAAGALAHELAQPGNGRRALYIASHAYAIDGMDDRDARQLLAELMDETTRREFVYVHKWRPGDVVMWDNRAMLHRGRPWDYSKERSMVRTTISATDADGLANVRPTTVH